MQDQWWRDKTAEVQHYADTHNAKKFFNLLKTVFSPSAENGFQQVEKFPVAPHYCRQMGRRSSKTRRVSASAARSTSALCWIGPRQLTRTPWIRSPNSPYEFRSQNPLPPRRSRRQSTRQSPAEHQGKDGIPAEIYKVAGPDALPWCPACCLGGGDDSRRLLRYPDRLPL